MLASVVLTIMYVSDLSRTGLAQLASVAFFVSYRRFVSKLILLH